MQKMINTLQHYAWGSKTALAERYGIANPQQQPVAELWMGAHPKSPSQVEINGQPTSLRTLIDNDKSSMLGDTVAKRFGELPFLFKVLCADKPLSIQVHPSKAAAEAGFAKEDHEGVPIDAAHRNYKDANHKPELVYALTPFLAMNGFRELPEMVSLLQPVAGAHPAIAHFLQQPDEKHLAELFSRLLSLRDEEKSRALAVLKSALLNHQGQPWQAIAFIADEYPDDSGLFSPLLLNVIELQPGEAMFLFAETPHAYLHGMALEVMANSDNVLRAGLTPKFIDIPELLANVRFSASPAATLLTTPQAQGNSLHFPIPVDDFAFAIHTLNTQPQAVSLHSAAILFCIEGEATLTAQHGNITLKAGESCFVAANDWPVSVSGSGRLAQVYNDC
ncbi:mannose-6-phosphate isomerase [Duffyella gerundensis]|uniref:mannose-6-phosphate isomerase n=1 Tax=Duffyella gerundensis TaxID=1619313 RepID=UPI001CE3873C|nr:mannose-6-phosphate isomerase [Duffyella gerundensis]UCB31115.1 mannose-6-phosphate isomerase [Duffyella gerundensis]